MGCHQKVKRAICPMRTRRGSIGEINHMATAIVAKPSKQPCKPLVNANVDLRALFMWAINTDKRSIKGIPFKKLMIHLVAIRGICGNNAKSFSYLFAPPSFLIWRVYFAWGVVIQFASLPLNFKTGETYVYA